MRLRRRSTPTPAVAPEVPDGPPVRRPGCDKECETRWDREPRHTEACNQRYREAVERVDAGQREYDEQMRRYIEFKARASEAERIAGNG